MLAREQYTDESRMVREYQICGYACRQLAQWALAHFGDRTDPTAYERIVISLGSSGPDFAVDKVCRDLTAQGFTYRVEAVWRMYERYRLDGARQFPDSQPFAA